MIMCEPVMDTNILLSGVGSTLGVSIMSPRNLLMSAMGARVEFNSGLA